ncbi:MAG: hypothetical protein ABI186_10040, partial [Candidatus Elarobacter sp.]
MSTLAAEIALGLALPGCRDCEESEDRETRGGPEAEGDQERSAHKSVIGNTCISMNPRFIASLGAPL